MKNEYVQLIIAIILLITGVISFIIPRKIEDWNKHYRKIIAAFVVATLSGGGCAITLSSANDVWDKQCHSCDFTTDSWLFDRYNYCPECHVKLKNNCNNCNRNLDGIQSTICPYCGEILNK